MKKILVTVFAFAMALALVACSADEQMNDTPEKSAEANADVTESVQHTQPQPAEEGQTEAAEVSDEALYLQMRELVESYIDIAHYNEYQTDNFSLKNELRPDYSEWKPASGYILVDGNTKIATDETKVSELLAQGWSFAKVEMETYEIGPERNVFTPSLFKNGKEIRVSLSNPSKEIINYKDAIIGSVHMDQYELNEEGMARLSAAVTFDIDGKLNQESSLADIINELGEPTSFTYVVRGAQSYIDITYGPMHFKLSVDGERIIEFECYGLN